VGGRGLYEGPRTVWPPTGRGVAPKVREHRRLVDEVIPKGGATRREGKREGGGRWGSFGIMQGHSGARVVQTADSLVWSNLDWENHPQTAIVQSRGRGNACHRRHSHHRPPPHHYSPAWGEEEGAPVVEEEDLVPGPLGPEREQARHQGPGGRTPRPRAIREGGPLHWDGRDGPRRGGDREVWGGGGGDASGAGWRGRSGCREMIMLLTQGQRCAKKSSSPG